MKWKLMRKIYPNANGSAPRPCLSSSSSSSGDDPNPMVVLTVWKKSLVLNCEGFTVFDGSGNLVYRVDNYINNRAAHNEIFLMDASGDTILTIRRRRKNLLLGGDSSWFLFDGETADNPRFRVTRRKNTRSRTHLLMSSSDNNNYNFVIEGSYVNQRRCCVYDEKRRRVAELKPKETSAEGVAFGADVFQLVLRPQFDPALAMAIVILLDHM